MSTSTRRRLAAAMPLALALLILASCKQSNDPAPDPGTPTNPDPTLPGGLAVVTASPVSTDGPIALGTTFSVTFDKDLAEATTGQGLRLTKGGIPVAAAISFSIYTPRTLTLDPTLNLDPGATYRLEATTTLRATDGSSLPAAVTWDYVAQNPLVPSIAVYRASSLSTIGGTPLADGVWTNEDIKAKAARAYTYSGGTLSILWSTDGSTWTEGAGSTSEAINNFSISTTDGTLLRVKARYVYQGAAYESDAATVNVDKTKPRVLSYEAPAPGKLEIAMSEPIYKSTAGDAPTAADFHFQSAEYWGAQFIITAVSGAGDTWTLDYTYRDSNGDHIDIIQAGMDRAGNYIDWCDTTVATLKAPTALQAEVTADGSISVTGITGPDFGDGFAVSAPTTDTDNNLSWTPSDGREPVEMSGLDLETRYYVRAANTIGTVGRSKGAKLWANSRAYLYPVLPFDEGAGTEASPWLIRNRADLERLVDDPAMRDDYFLLAADLDLSRYAWQSVGYIGPVEFTGHFDGAGHSITGGTSALWNGGIIECARDASIHDLVVRNATIDGYLHAQGFIVNQAYGSTAIERAAVENFEVTSGGSWSGGVVGQAGKISASDNAISIKRCYAQGRVVDSSQGYVGGIAGSSYGTTIEDCFAAVDVAGSERDYCAGLVGEACAGTIVRRAFASGAIDTDQDSAGLVGISSIATNKPVLESLVAMNPSIGKAGYESTHTKRYRAVYANVSGTPPLSHWATATNIYANSAMTVDGATVADSDVNGTGMTLAAFKASASPCFSGWDFAATWIMTANGPSLRNMPLGGATFGTPAIDPVGWD